MIQEQYINNYLLSVYTDLLIYKKFSLYSILQFLALIELSALSRKSLFSAKKFIAPPSFPKLVSSEKAPDFSKLSLRQAASNEKNVSLVSSGSDSRASWDEVLKAEMTPSPVLNCNRVERGALDANQKPRLHCSENGYNLAGFAPSPIGFPQQQTKTFTFKDAEVSSVAYKSSLSCLASIQQPSASLESVQNPLPNFASKKSAFVIDNPDHDNFHKDVKVSPPTFNPPPLRLDSIQNLSLIFKSEKSGPVINKPDYDDSHKDVKVSPPTFNPPPLRLDSVQSPPLIFKSEKSGPVINKPDYDDSHKDVKVSPPTFNPPPLRLDSVQSPPLIFKSEKSGPVINKPDYDDSHKDVKVSPPTFNPPPLRLDSVQSPPLIFKSEKSGPVINKPDYDDSHQDVKPSTFNPPLSCLPSVQNPPAIFSAAKSSVLEKLDHKSIELKPSRDVTPTSDRSRPLVAHSHRTLLQDAVLNDSSRKENDVSRCENKTLFRNSLFNLTPSKPDKLKSHPDDSSSPLPSRLTGLSYSDSFEFFVKNLKSFFRHIKR